MLADLLINLLILYFVGYLVVLIHELGHYSVFYAKKLTPLTFSVGIGKNILRFSWKGTWFYLKLIPVKGFVEYTPGELKKLGYFGSIAMYSMGPAFNLVCFILLGSTFGYMEIISYTERLWTEPTIYTFVHWFGFLSLFVGVFNLYPRKTKDHSSDGYKILWTLPRKKLYMPNDNW